MTREEDAAYLKALHEFLPLARKYLGCESYRALETGALDTLKQLQDKLRTPQPPPPDRDYNRGG